MSKVYMWDMTSLEITKDWALSGEGYYKASMDMLGMKISTTAKTEEEARNKLFEKAADMVYLDAIVDEETIN